MRLQRVLGLSALIGFLVPVFFTGLFAILTIANFYNPGIAMPFVWMRLFFWPTSIGLMALDGSPNWSLSSLAFVLIVAITNVPVYLALGGLFWLVKRKRHTAYP